MNTTNTSRNPWPIAIVVWFILFAIFLVSFIVWAVRQRVDLVSDNYYEHEVRYQQQVDRLNNSRALATQVVVTFDPAAHRIVISLPAAESQGATGHIHLYRPSDARLDRDLPLALNASGMQQLDARELRNGLWKVRLEWTAKGHEFYLDQPVIVTSS